MEHKPKARAGIPMTDGTPAPCRQKNAASFLAGDTPGVMASYGHGGRDFAKKGVGGDDADRPYDDVCFASGDNDDVEAVARVEEAIRIRTGEEGDTVLQAHADAEVPA